MKDKPHITSLCGFEPDQTEADVSNQDLDVGDAILLAFDLKKNSVLVKLECAQEPRTTEALTAPEPGCASLTLRLLPCTNASRSVRNNQLEDSAKKLLQEASSDRIKLTL